MSSRSSIPVHPFDDQFISTMLIIVFVVISCFIHTCNGTCNQLDRDSLLSFKLNISAASPLNWSLTEDCCKWEGIGCDDSGRVTNLWLPSRQLVGSISPSILNLICLAKLNLSQNMLSGSLPEGFFAAFDLLQVLVLSNNHLSGGITVSDKLPVTIRTFNLSSNHFQGTIPSQFFQLDLVLETFDVSNNSFSGPIPVSVCSYAPLIQSLDFSKNSFAGPIPQGFRHCLNLQSLRAGYNRLSGDIPQDIYGLAKLQELYMPANSLSGQIDKRIVNLINLKILSLYGNNLTSTIPQDIGRLSKLELLLLHKNQLNGTIPPSLGNCSKLVMLNLKANSLEGELSTIDFSKLAQLKSIYLGQNFFTGALPASLFSCKTLKVVGLNSNNLSGEMPPGIATMQALSILALFNNSLTNIKSAISILAGCKNLTILVLGKNFYGEVLPGSESLISSEGFPNLQVLALSHCRLTGAVPIWLSRLENLALLDLSFNNITGSIPGWIGTLPNLFNLDLSNNQISGHFPAELAELPRVAFKQNSDQAKQSYLEITLATQSKNSPMLQYQSLHSFPPALYMSDNRIRGTIPDEIGQLKFLWALDLSNNDFSGSIPDTLSNLTNLEKLDLSRNRLSGELPASLVNLNFLSFFSIAYNNLQGKIPSGGQFDTFPCSSFVGNPGLRCGSQHHILPDSNRPKGESRQDLQNENEVICWVGFEIGFSVSCILTLLAVPKFFQCGIIQSLNHIVRYFPCSAKITSMI